MVKDPKLDLACMKVSMLRVQVTEVGVISASRNMGRSDTRRNSLAMYQLAN